ncbi:carboxynorspermidine decarboxylase [Ruminococcus sp. CLA-AA-H200]|uniref:Carboxynorspermidine decarboxylase n=1 Tax=Ruminococcus turbiniformis TaxID=2881258 RepID=A0ABS8FV15_9FIRM|nr:carboxynorspermidine decarboxylase [Ruminococcus turbiniformis]MCC2253901.1 carboxynorspermidine decarboxylase [Ruminococcus turbiniformis]
MNREKLRTPCYVVQEQKLRENLEILREIREETGCRILLAQKAFSMYRVYPMIGEYLDGATASGLYEARLGYEEMGKENHIFSPAYREEEMPEILRMCGHIVFNSPAQFKKYRDQVRKAGRSAGLRINPECSTQEGHAIYDPCAPYSRLGTTLKRFCEEMSEEDISGLDGLHFHTLCEQNADDLAVTLDEVEEKFGPYLKRMKWLNFGGGHHITRADYDRELLKKCIRHMKETYDLEIYLEPGEAIALNAGVLLTEVLEIVDNGMKIAILDTSAACHMPDVLEMPYRPPLRDAGNPETDAQNGEGYIRPYIYRLAGPTCLAGDVIGDYSFEKPIQIGDRLEFQDMAIYTMVKTNTFNGMKLPDIVLEKEDGTCEMVRTFGYEDFKSRL